MIRVQCGDSRVLLRELPDSSVDSVVSDPPYELGFMGKGWDKTGIAYDVELWREVFRVLKPGGHLVAFGGTRTYHRMVCAIEDAGFEIRDQLAWVYGSGFPKSHDVGKAIDKDAGAEREVVGFDVNAFAKRNRRRAEGGMPALCGGFSDADNGATITAPATPEAEQWEGWGTALKPAWEPICLARKPLVGTVAHNVLTHGTGALNIDGCRIEGGARAALDATAKTTPSQFGAMGGSKAIGMTNLGRWPANIIHDGSDEVLAGFPETKSGARNPSRRREREGNYILYSRNRIG